jgi:hypothetical protein
VDKNILDLPLFAADVKYSEELRRRFLILLNPGKTEDCRFKCHSRWFGGRFVLRKPAQIWMIAIVCLAGFASDRIEAGKSGAGRHDFHSGMIEYLRRQNPPGLNAVKVWNNEYGPGLKLTTAHYEIFTTLLEPTLLARISGFIESAYKAYNLQLPEPIETRNRFTIYLFADRRQWEHFTNDFAGEQAEIFRRIKAGAYCHNGACVAYDIGSERTFSVLAHEGWHQFSGRHFKFRLPSWLDEGVAMLFETQMAEDGTFSFDPAKNAYRLDALKKAMAKGKMLPLRRLIATTPGDVLATDQSAAVTGFYSQSYALIRFLREADGGKRLNDYYRLLADGLRGNWPLDDMSKKIAADRNIPRSILWNQHVSLVLFREYIGDDFEPVEKEYRAFCRQIVTDGLRTNPDIRTSGKSKAATYPPYGTPYGADNLIS